MHTLARDLCIKLNHRGAFEKQVKEGYKGKVTSKSPIGAPTLSNLAIHGSKGGRV